jgi:hypothetical protein
MEKEKKKNPWLGLESYQEGEVLYGRDEDIRDLSQCILNDKETLLYGKSGIGKSSILNAGIIPAARRHGYLPVLVRLSHKEGKSYLFQIREAIGNAMIPIPLDESGNQITLSAEEQLQREIELKKRIRKVVGCKDKEKESLYEFFHRHTFHNAEGERLKLLIIFDQFEEIFTLQTDESRKKLFFAELADFLNDVIPTALQHDLTFKPEDLKTIAVIAEGNFGNLFNDLNIGSGNKFPEYVTDNDIHLVFTIREDFLSEFEYYSASIPSLKQNRYGLRPINEEQAAQIILRPMPGLIDESVAKMIIEKVTGRTDFKLDGIPEIEVDSAVLSLYLNRLYDAKAEDKITSNLIEQKGGEIIASFYNDAISGISETTIEYLEDMLLNGQGRRDNITIFDAINDGGATEKELDVLCNKKKILRQFNYAGDLRIEYVHDILCPVVKMHKEGRILLKQQEKERQRILQEEEQKRQEIEAAAAIRLKRLRWVLFAVAMTSVFIIFAGFQYFKNLASEDEFVDVMFVFVPEKALEGDPWEVRAIFTHNDVSLFDEPSFKASLINNKIKKYDSIMIKGPNPDTLIVRMLKKEMETDFTLQVYSKTEWLCESEIIPIELKAPKKDELQSVTYPIQLKRDKKATFLLNGSVTNLKGNAIVDAFVVLNDKLARTNSEGCFSFSLKDSTELKGSVLNVLKSEYETFEIEGEDILSELRGAETYKIVIGLREKYDSLYTEEVNRIKSIRSHISDKLYSAEDSAYLYKFFGNDKKYIPGLSIVQAGDTTITYIFKLSSRKSDAEKGRIFGFYKREGESQKPFNGYLRAIDPLPNGKRRWKMSIITHDSIYNKERIVGTIVQDANKNYLNIDKN